MTEQERWRAIEDALPKLRSICRRTLKRANCYTLTTDELLSELVPMCFRWLENFDPSVSADPMDLLGVSVVHKSKNIVQEAIKSHDNLQPLESVQQSELPSYVVDMIEQMEGFDVSSVIAKLPPRLAFIATAMSEGQTLQAIGEQLGITRHAVFYEWQKAQQALAMMLQQSNRDQRT